MAVIPFTTGSIQETINFANDPTDLFQVNLIGGIDYVATALGAANAGGTLQYPYIVLFDGAGNFLTSSDNSFGRW